MVVGESFYKIVDFVRAEVNFQFQEQSAMKRNFITKIMIMIIK